jgi:hypothetical protein
MMCLFMLALSASLDMHNFSAEPRGVYVYAHSWPPSNIPPYMLIDDAYSIRNGISNAMSFNWIAPRLSLFVTRSPRRSP